MFSYRRLLVVAIATVGIIIPATSAARTNAAPRHRHCAKTFTIEMFDGAADRTYSGTDLPKKGAYGHLWHYAKCMRGHHGWGRAITLWAKERDAWNARRHPPASYTTQVVSYYDDAGTHCCGYYSHYGVADCANYTDNCYPMGTQVEFCYRSCITATVDDHGPYISGRYWDLNTNTAEAIGFTGTGVGPVQWRLK